MEKAVGGRYGDSVHAVAQQRRGGLVEQVDGEGAAARLRDALEGGVA